MNRQYFFRSKKGLSDKTIEQLIQIKKEPAWMRDYRRDSFRHFVSAKMPAIKGLDLSEINFEDIYSFLKPIERQVDKWEKLPGYIKTTYEKLNIPTWERKYLSGISAQYESMVVYEKAKEELRKQGVIFVDMDTAIQKYGKLLRPYFGQIVNAGENIFSAVNSAFWSGGVFIYVPKNVKVKLPLQSYFYISKNQFGQFERTLILADEGSEVTYLEGCSAPVYSSYSLHAGLVEIIVKKNAKVRYVTVQNWSKNIYNISIKRAQVEENGTIDWTMASIGSKMTISYPTSILKGKGAKSSHTGLTVSSQHQTHNAGAKVVHLAPATTSNIISKSISLKGGKSIFTGNIKIPKGVPAVKSFMQCHSLIMDNHSSSLSFPSLEVENEKAQVGHEATFGGLSEEQLFYLKSRGLTDDQATTLLINGYINPVIKDLPPDYIIELRRLMEMEITGA